MINIDASSKVYMLSEECETQINSPTSKGSTYGSFPLNIWFCEFKMQQQHPKIRKLKEACEKLSESMNRFLFRGFGVIEVVPPVDQLKPTLGTKGNPPSMYLSWHVVCFIYFEKE